MIYLLLALLSIPVYFYYRRTLPELIWKKRVFLAILRWLSISFVILILLNPILYLVRKYTYKPELLILNDTSTSMKLSADGKTKSQLLSSYVGNLKDKFTKAGYRITEDSFADGYRGKSGSTNLVQALETMSQSGKLSHTSKILLVSDGWFRDENLDDIGDLNIPIITFNPSVKPDSTDIQISFLRYDRIAYKNEKTPLTVGINASRYNGKAIVKLLMNKKVVASQVTDFRKDSFQQVTFEPVFTQTGLQTFEVTSECINFHEHNLDNNNYPGAFQVLNDKSRILILTDTGNWDAKFIQDAIHVNSRWKADIYLVRDGQAWKGNQAIPASQINSIPYESFIIVNNGNLYMPDAIRQAIMGKVEGGSGLLFMGKPVAGLGMMLPASSSNIANTYQSNFKLNAAAGAYSFLDYDAKVIADIPPVQYYYVQAKEGSAVLGTMDNDQNSPAILFKQFGKGKVFEFAFLDLWKWQMWVDNSDYHTVIGNILLWMGNQDLLRFRAQTTKNSYFLGERVRIVLSAVDDKQMPVTDLDAQIQILNSHNRAVYSDYLLKDGDDYQVQLSSLEPDTYHFKVYDERTKQRTEGSFIVSNSNMENRDYGFNQPALFYVSQITNGKSLSQSDLSVYKPMKEQTKPDIRRMEIPLYRKWYLITLFLVCFCVELLFRRIWGLL